MPGWLFWLFPIFLLMAIGLFSAITGGVEEIRFRLWLRRFRRGK